MSARIRHGLTLATACILLTGSPAVEATGLSGGLSGFMLPGMRFRDLTLQHVSADGRTRQILNASDATIREQPNLLWISDLNLRAAKPGEAGFHLQAERATYDFHANTIRVSDGFTASASGVNIRGNGLGGDTDAMKFNATGNLEISRSVSTPFAKLPRPAKMPATSPFLTPAPPAQRLAPWEMMSRLACLQDFSGNLQTFEQCWSWVAERTGTPGSEKRNPTALISPSGGQLDMAPFGVRLTGRSAFLSPKAVLISTGGIRMLQEEFDGEPLIRITGKGGVKAWIPSDRSGEIWIRSTAFKSVSDHQALQFTGGPLQISRHGVVLTAAENWQFARVFDGNRIVLSTGDWNVVGDLNPTRE